MRKNIEKVIEAFKQGKPAKGDSKATCHTDGEVVYSYALPIAIRSPGRFGCADEVKIREDYPTATTRSQISALFSAFPDAIPVDEIGIPGTRRIR